MKQIGLVDGNTQLITCTYLAINSNKNALVLHLQSPVRHAIIWGESNLRSKAITFSYKQSHK